MPIECNIGEDIECLTCTKYRLKVSLDMSYCRDWEQNNCVPAVNFFSVTQCHKVCT